MAEVSRTARVIQNAKVALFFYCINLILQFFSRKIFLDYLGAELLGLNTTAQNLLQFLNLAESGIGTAVAFALYKPLSQKNRQEIIDIVSLQGWFYRWVGLFVIAGSIVLMAFFPWIFAKTKVPLIYVYGTYIAFLISSLMSYFVNYKIIVLSADQKEYKITVETQTIKVIKVLFQMIAIWKLPQGYLWWMALEALSGVITSIRLTLCVKKEYPWLCVSTYSGREHLKNYDFLVVRIKQFFFQHIASFILLQSTPLLIYIFSGLTEVAIYGNYLIIIGSCFMLSARFELSLQAGVGNLVAVGSLDRIKSVFWEIYTIRLLISGYICCAFFILVEPFIKLWIGESYILSLPALILMTAIYFIQMSQTTNMFLKAYGLFRDVWAPVAQALLNICLSIGFGYFLGISGVLTGVLISQVLIIKLWKPYFLYKEAFHENFIEYIVLYIKKLSLLFIVFMLTFVLSSNFVLIGNYNYCDWIMYAVIVSIIYCCIGSLFFYVLDHSFREVLHSKIKNLL